MGSEISVVLRKPTVREAEFLDALSKPGAVIETLVPEDIGVSEWNMATSATCKALRRAMAAEQALMPVLGHLLNIAEARPEIWNTRFDTFSHFKEGEIYEKFGVGRSTCYEAQTIARRFGDLEQRDYQQITRRQFKLLATAIPPGEEKARNHVEMIEKAKTMTDSEFAEYVHQQTGVSGADVSGEIIRIGTSKRIAQRWERFIAEPRIQAVCETANPGRILDKMMQECSGEWMAQAGEAGEEEAAS